MTNSRAIIPGATLWLALVLACLGGNAAARSQYMLAVPATSVALGHTHSCTLGTDGNVRCWGKNDVGQLGDGRTEDSEQPVRVTGLPRGQTVALSAGSYTTCAILRGGEIRCWGRNVNGEAGQNPGTLRVATPVRGNLFGGSSPAAVKVSVGLNQACALREDRKLFCWGQGRYLGLGNAQADSPTPLQVPLTGNPRDVSASQQFTCAITSFGSGATVTLTFCWGGNASGQSGGGTTAASYTPRTVDIGQTSYSRIFTGAQHTCAVTFARDVHCWGDNSYNQLNLGNTAQTNVPTAIPALQGADELALGTSHTCAVRDDNTRQVKCMGTPTQAIGHFNGSPNPDFIAADSSGTYTVAAGSYRTCIVQSPGTVRCFGHANYPSGDITRLVMGDGRTLAYSDNVRMAPYKVFGHDSGATEIDAGTSATCALSFGGLHCWGRSGDPTMVLLGTFGTAGVGVVSGRPITIEGLEREVITDVSVGGGHICVLTSPGDVWCWGYNQNGQLGRGDLPPTPGQISADPVPQRVVGLGAAARQVAAGGSFTCALLTTGAVKCWGRGDFGAMGNGLRADSRIPVQVSTLTSGVAEVAAGELHACVRTETGAMRCWGNNASGQVGIGLPANSDQFAVTTPRAILASGVSKMGLGSEHTCAIQSGALKCWGFNDSGQIGNGSAGTNIGAPVAVVDHDSEVVAVAAGVRHTCSTTRNPSDNTFFQRCWGANHAGQLGDNGSSTWPTPRAVVPTLLTGAFGLVAGYEHSCIVADDGNATAPVCWGDDRYGVIGLGYGNSPTTTVPIRTPTFPGMKGSLPFKSSLLAPAYLPNGNSATITSSAFSFAAESLTPQTCTVSTNTVTARALSEGPSLCLLHVRRYDNTIPLSAESPRSTVLIEIDGPLPPTCDLDVDASGSVDIVDATLIMRYLFGYRGNALTGGLSIAGSRNDGTALALYMNANRFDTSGRGAQSPLVDGMIITRLITGLGDAALLAGIAVPPGGATTAAGVRSYVNQQCGQHF